MATPINVHEVMAALTKIPRDMYVVINRECWRLKPMSDLGDRNFVIASGDTAGELRKALQARAMPTAEEAIAFLDKIVMPGTLEDYTPEIVAYYRGVRRFIEAHKEQPDE